MDTLKKLTLGAEELGLKLAANQLNQLAELQNQLIKWTAIFNLTSITDEERVVKCHLLDSLTIVPFWNGSQRQFDKTLDVGTGAGFPGLPLAIALPQQEFHLLDSNNKKIRFIRQQIHHLGLKNVTAFHSRVQQHEIKNYDAIVSRAFSKIAEMVEMTQPLLAQGGSWMAMKGVYFEAEKQALPDWVVETHCHRLSVPGLNAARCLVELTRRKD